MPIYAYKCDTCGHSKDVLQKISDAPLTACPQCGAATFHKQVTAAGFQLKGSGWYVTDFRGGAAATGADSTSAPDSKDNKPAAAEGTAGNPATASPAPAAAPASAPASPAPSKAE